MARTSTVNRLLTTEEAAKRLGVTPAHVAALARQGEFGMKDGRSWVFRASELRAYTRRRRRVDPFFMRQPRAPREPRVSRADRAAFALLDDLLAREREVERQYALPFRAPPQVGMTVHQCQVCHRDMLLLIFADNARDAAGLEAYGRLVEEPIRRANLPAYALAPLDLVRPLDESRSLLMRVWPERGAPREITLPEWDRFVVEVSRAHCPGGA